MKKYQNFLSENFHVLVVKFSVYLNRQVFVMMLFSIHSFGKRAMKTLFRLCVISQNGGSDATRVFADSV